MPDKKAKAKSRSRGTAAQVRHSARDLLEDAAATLEDLPTGLTAALLQAIEHPASTRAVAIRTLFEECSGG